MEPQTDQTPGSADALKHPSQEQWMDFLHGELSPRIRWQLTAHLSRCQVCRESVKHWKSAAVAMNEWALPEKSPSARPVVQPWIRWAAAALIILGFGFGAGRLNARTPDAEKISRAVEKSVRAQLVAEVRAECRKELQTSRAELIESIRADLDQTAMETLAASSAETRRLLSDFNTTYALNRAEDRESLLAAWRSLRKELETVAVLTQDSLDKAQNQLLKLATLTDTSRTLPTP